MTFIMEGAVKIHPLQDCLLILFQLSPTRLYPPNLGVHVTQNIYPWLYNVSFCHEALPMARG